METISTGVRVTSDNVLDVMAMNHIDRLELDRLELPLKVEVITRYKNEVFNKEPFEQHLNFRRLTLSKAVLGERFKMFKALKLWEILVPKLIHNAHKPTNMRRLLQSLYHTANHLFGVSP